MKSRLVELFQSVDSVINSENFGMVTKSSVSHCEKFSTYFMDKIEQIWKYTASMGIALVTHVRESLEKHYLCWWFVIEFHKELRDHEKL